MFTEFFVQNWVLFLALFAVIALMLFDPTTGRSGAARAVSPMEVTRLINHEHAVLVDVRSAEEYEKGHITKAKNIPLDNIKDSVKKLEKFKKRPIVIICQTGARAGKAATELKKLEFDKLFFLSGGLTEWQKENLPLFKAKTPAKTAKANKSKSKNS